MHNKSYMSVGELAKKMHTTVRTLQYYDKERLLCPSSQSEGGRRLYTHKDMIKLHQIQSLKSLGFSLEEIKNKLMPLDTPEEVAAILSKQALTIQDQIQQLSKSLQEIELLKEEVLQMQQVDFKKYADIIVNLQMNNQYYWLIKHFDDSTLDHIRHRFNKDTGLSFIHRFNQLIEEILILKDNNVSPDNIEAQKAAQKFWNIVMEFTNGDMSLLPELMKFNDQLDEQNEWTKKQRIANEYIQPALEIYFQNAGVDPFKEQ